jgi:hypothetical protein
MPLSNPSASAHWQVVTRLDRFKTLRPLLEARRGCAWPAGGGRLWTVAARLRPDRSTAIGDAGATASIGARGHRHEPDVETFC